MFLIGCIYTPNIYFIDFYARILSDVSANVTPFSGTILAGQFNCTIYSAIDRNPKKEKCICQNVTGHYFFIMLFCINNYKYKYNLKKSIKRLRQSFLFADAIQ